MAPSREVLDAQRDLTRGQRRVARRALRRGQAVDDPAVARLAVALARLQLRHQPSRGLVCFFAVLVVGWAGMAVTTLAAGRILAGAAFALLTPYGIWALHRLRPVSVDAARTAERLNRDSLRRAGRPYGEEPRLRSPFEPARWALALAALGVWVVQDLVFGTLSDAVDGRSLSPAHAVARGALFATAMTIVNLTVMRRRTRLQSERTFE